MDASSHGRTSIWRNWRIYMPRWLLAGALMGMAQIVVGDFDHFWIQKFGQALGGLPVGMVGFVIFMPLQNRLNIARVRWKTLMGAAAAWLVAEFIFFSALYSLGIAPP